MPGRGVQIGVLDEDCLPSGPSDYTDHGSDFISQHIEQVAADLKIALIFSLPGAPRGRGKMERFFGTVKQMLIPELPGYAPKGSTGIVPELSLPAFDALFRTWLLDDYHQRIQSEMGSAPQARWEAEGFLPRMPESLEQLDLLLLTVAKGDGCSKMAFTSKAATTWT